MQLTMLKSKIHRATLTGANLDYEGSISIDEELLKESGIRSYEQVHVVNVDVVPKLVANRLPLK